MTLTVITPPSGEAVPLDAVKDYLRIGHSQEDDLCRALMASAIAGIEARYPVAFLSRTLLWQLTRWPDGLSTSGHRLKPMPVQAVTEIRHIDRAGVRTQITAKFEQIGSVLRLKAGEALPALSVGERAEIRFTAGHDRPGDIPQDLQFALILQILQAYMRRGSEAESSTDKANEIKAHGLDLLAPYKEVRV